MNKDDAIEQEKEKDKKIKLFQKRLKKIREAAYWLDHITGEHTADFKRRKDNIAVLE